MNWTDDDWRLFWRIIWRACLFDLFVLPPLVAMLWLLGAPIRFVVVAAVATHFLGGAIVTEDQR